MEGSVEKTVFEEFMEGEGAAYVISIDDSDESGIITQLTLRVAKYPLKGYANRYGDEIVLSFSGGALRIVYKEFAYEWGGTYTRTRAEVVIKTDFQEIPWFCVREELEGTLSECGVKTTIIWVIDYIRDLIQGAIPQY